VVDSAPLGIAAATETVVAGTGEPEKRMEHTPNGAKSQIDVSDGIVRSAVILFAVFLLDSLTTSNDPGR
jgi:hypothetical protein